MEDDKNSRTATELQAIFYIESTLFSIIWTRRGPHPIHASQRLLLILVLIPRCSTANLPAMATSTTSDKDVGLARKLQATEIVFLSRASCPETAVVWLLKMDCVWKGLSHTVHVLANRNTSSAYASNERPENERLSHARRQAGSLQFHPS